MMRRFFLLGILLLTACTQEITNSPQLPVVTSAFMTATNTATPPPTPVPATATPITFPSPAPLPPGPVSIITIGDSLTQGDGDDSGRGYPGRLLELVNQIRPGTTITNFGLSGWTSDALINGDQGYFGQLMRAADESRSALASNRSAVVLVWTGSNDLWYLYEYGGDVTPAQEAEDAARFEANIETVLSELRTTGAQVIIALLDDQSQRPVALRGEAFTAITPDELAMMSEQVKRYNSIIQSQAAQYGALTVDFYNSDIFITPATLADDGNHPNAAGYDLITQAWYKALITILP